MVETGEVMSKQALHAKVAEMSKNLLEETKKKGKKHLPSKCWVYHFLDWNLWLMLRQPMGLDAVCA